MALGAKVINLIGLHLLDDSHQIAAIGEIAVVQHQPWIAFVGVLIKMVDAAGIKTAGSAFYAMNLVPLFQQQFR